MSKIVTVGATVLFAFLISAVHLNVAQAQTRTVAVACGKQLQKQCGGMPVLANNLRECLQKSQGKILCAVVRQTHCSIARPPQRVKAIFSDA